MNNLLFLEKLKFLQIANLINRGFPSWEMINSGVCSEEGFILFNKN